MTVKAVVFDVDNTLIDSNAMFEKFTEHLIEHHCESEPLSEKRRMLALLMDSFQSGNKPRKIWVKEASLLLKGDSDAIADEIYQDWYDHFADYCVRKDNLYSVLEEIRMRGFKLGIITNGMSYMQNRKIDKANLRSYVDVVFVSGEFGVDKPDVRIFHAALQQLEVLPQEAVYVGDHPVNDVQGAREAGMRPVWVEGFQPWDPSVKKPEFTIQTLPELLPLLHSI